MKRMIVFAALALTACGPSDQEARSAVEAFGFEDVTISSKFGGLWGGCSEKDYWAWKFTATNVRGKRVRGTVCAGMFKEPTIRVGS